MVVNSPDQHPPLDTDPLMPRDSADQDRQFSELERCDSGKYHNHKVEQTVFLLASDIPSKTQGLRKPWGQYENWLLELDRNTNTPCFAWHRGRGRQNAS